jgi:uncharacterized protein involved in exopolysaccharide biosynthesis
MTTEPTPQPTRAPDPGDSADLFDLSGLRNDAGFVLRSPRRHKRLAVACFAGVAVLAALSSFLLPDVYRVQAGILALRNPVMSTLSNPGLVRPADFDAPTKAARETVMRRDNLVALCEQTRLVERYLKTRSALGRLRAWVSNLVTKQPTHAELLEGLADTLERKLWVNVSQEGTVAITFEWPDRDIAYSIVEAAVQNFLEARHASELAVVGETISLLEGRAGKLQEQLKATLEDVERKERSRPHPAVRSTAPRPAALPVVRRDDDTGRLQGMLTARRRALTDLEEFRARRLAELTAQLAQKEATYADRHPEVVTTRQSIEALSQPSPQVEALRTEIRDLERELGSRGVPVEATRSAAPGAAFRSDLILGPRLLGSDDVRDEYDRGQLRLLFDQYSSVLLRLDSARAELELSQAAFKYRYSVISPPQIPKGPVKPYLLLRLIAGIGGGIGLALFACALVDLRSRRIIELWQVERHLGLPVLAQLRR